MHTPSDPLWREEARQSLFRVIHGKPQAAEAVRSLKVMPWTSGSRASALLLRQEGLTIQEIWDMGHLKAARKRKLHLPRRLSDHSEMRGL